MKRIIFIIFFAFPLYFFAQDNVSCRIILKNGQTLQIHHFGYLKCGGVMENNPYKDVVVTQGYYETLNDFHEKMIISDYGQIDRMELLGFNRKPKYGYGLKKRRDKGTIKIYQKNGQVIVLEFAYLHHTCSGTYSDGSNELRLQILDPDTNKIQELKLGINKIKYIEF